MTPAEHLDGSRNIKEAEQVRNFLVSQNTAGESERRAEVTRLIQQSSTAISVLEVLHDADARLYLGAGLVRNMIWDYLHGFGSSTPVNDVDVVYFDKLNATKADDLQIEQRLRDRTPDFQWSVKNQARMHLANGDKPYSSLADAIAKWPETATAIAIRLHAHDQIEILAPFGLSDLFQLLVVPTPHFQNRSAYIRSRIMEKQWQTSWPKLRVILP